MECRHKLKTLDILLVEDERKLAFLLKNAIAEEFGSFALAHDGEEGLEKFQALHPDIVISDITMPKMDGLSMAEKIKKSSPQTPIILLSAYSDKEKLLSAIDIGAVKYFIKPFDPEEIVEYICKLSKKLNKKRIVKLMEPFTYDITNAKLFKHGVLVHLSKRETLFITSLLHNPNYFMPNETIKQRLWPDEEISDARLRTFIKRIRQKTDKSIIENISGQGYMLKCSSPYDL